MNKKPRVTWTKEKCHEIALNYTSRNEFSIGNRSVYTISSRNKWLDDICSHMIRKTKPDGYWTYETCKEEATKYTTQKDFYNSCRTGYEYARANKWLDDICNHMTPSGNRYNRLIYAYIFSDKHVYIGLTYNAKVRFYEHTTKDKDSPVYKHILSSGLQPEYKLLTDYIDIKEAQKEEAKYIKQYLSDGYTLLNKAKAGGLGNSIASIWTKERCELEAQKYKSKFEFYKGCSGAYNTCTKNAWLNDVCSHMVAKHKPVGYWTYDKCKEAAIGCRNKQEYYEKFGGAFVSAKKNNWLSEFFPKKS